MATHKPPTKTPIPGKFLNSGFDLSKIIANRSGAASYIVFIPAKTPSPPDTVSNAKYVVIKPPSTKKITWITSVQATADNPPYKEYAAANNANPITPYRIGTPIIVSKANEPKYNTEARLTNTYRAIQKTASMVFKLVENLFSTNSGMVYNPFTINIGKKYFPTIINVSAAIHS